MSACRSESLIATVVIVGVLVGCLGRDAESTDADRSARRPAVNSASGWPRHEDGTVMPQGVTRAVADLVQRGRHPLTGQLLEGGVQAEMVALYTTGGFGTLWTNAEGRLTAGAREALDLLAGAAADGLEPAEYQASALQEAFANVPHTGHERRADEMAALDVLLSLRVLRYLRHLHHGRVDPRTVGFHVTVPADSHDFLFELQRAIQEQRVGEAMKALAPSLTLYRSLREMLARYRALAARPVPRLSTTDTIRQGDAYADAANLSDVLRVLGDLPVDAMPRTQDVYDTALSEGVKRFQVRHGLEPDGVLGPATYGALRVPLAWRVRQIELALERLRWLPHLGPDRVVAVNIPMFQLWAWNADAPGKLPAVSMKAIVGRALNTQTPVFVDEITEITFRPYWNIPTSILRGEILPAMRRDPNYLAQHDMEVVSSEPLGIRQRPGPRNSLGLIKFVFPNALDIYMHGTPAQALFDRSRRDFSHGCVRLSDPAGLAEWALSGQDDWTRDRVLQAMHASTSRSVTLARPIQVILFYVTAVVMPEDGAIHFAPDIYRHDDKLDRTLRERDFSEARP